MTGPCAKRRVICEILFDGLVVTGENDCENPQPVCPREPGEDYTKCKTICRQGAHAEIRALENVEQPDRLALAGATAIVRGHTYACKDCQEALFGAGVRWLRVDSAEVRG